MAVSQPIDDVLFFEVKREGAKYRKRRSLHPNLLPPFMCVTDDVRNIEDDKRSDASVPVVVDDDEQEIVRYCERERGSVRMT